MPRPLRVIQGGTSSAKPKADWKLLLDEAKKALANAVEIRVHPSRVYRMEDQPRVYFSQESLLRLAESIRGVGQVYPGIVRKIGKDQYELLDGERRWRAVTIIGIEYKALLVEIKSDAVPFLIAAIANFNREAHTPLEIADAIRTMYDDMGMPIEEVAKVLGMNSQWAYAMLSLRHLHQEVRDMLDPMLPKKERLPVTAAIKIAKVAHKLQPALARRVLAKDVSLKGLRRETLRVSKKEGAFIKTNNTPSRRWMSIATRANQLRTVAYDLKDDFTQDDFTQLAKNIAGAYTVSDVLTSLQNARRHIDECEKLLLKAKGSK